MPEIKHNFMKGKMNKDLDERLVPNGEYRDALNIQVSTSEGSDVGTVQNILGNSLIAGQGFLPVDGVCVGSIADEKNDKLYYFITQKNLILNGSFDNGDDWIVSTSSGYTGNQWTFSNNQAVGTAGNPGTMVASAPGVVDGNKYTITYDIVEASSNGVLILANHSFVGGINTNGSDNNVILAGEDTIGTYTVEWEQGPSSDRQDEIWLYNSPDYEGTIDNISVFKSDSARSCIIEYDSKTNTITPVFVDMIGDVLKFDENNTITGINIIDNLLLWTDNVNEPRKINIDRSKAGTDASGLIHTNLIVDGSDEGLIKEEYITVIKKAPSKAPDMDIVKGSVGAGSYIDGALDTYAPLFYPFGTEVVEGDEMWIGIQNLNGSNSNPGTVPDLAVGDVIRLYNGSGSPLQGEDHIARLSIKEIAPPGQFSYPQIQNNFLNAIIALSHQTAVKVSVSTLIPHAPSNFNNYYFELEQADEGIFERKFPRFACRYKYEDNEYSSVGPFSEVVFVPGEFEYHPTKAYNKGMINDLKELTLKDFVTSDIPHDVVQIDLLYKNEFSPNIYVIKTIDKDDIYWSANSGEGAYTITTENVYAQIPSDQLIRPWDNVPRRALAQEITGNRVAYGNYAQGYDLLDSEGLPITPSLSATLESRLGLHGSGNLGLKSLKSQRTYNVGVVYGDEYGRETPVFTNDTANQLITKSSSASVNALAVDISSDFPTWADYYKIFIKETSNEYYNLAMGRMYDAADSNVWISFPSVDRNKVDEDTYLILKKGVGEDSGAVLTSTTVLENPNARYKVVAIENEAPDFIKTEYTLLAETTNKIAGVILFGGVGYANTGNFALGSPAEGPTPGTKSFTIDKHYWEGTGGGETQLGLPSLSGIWDTRGDSDIYVSFSNRKKLGGYSFGSIYTTTPMSEKFKVTSVETIDSDTPTAGWNGNALSRITLSEIIPQDQAYLTDYLATGVPVESGYHYGGRLRPHFYKKEVINKPEFDGRFFVKIIEDELLSKSLRVNDAPVDQGWEVDVKIDNVYYLKDGATGNTGYPESKTKTNWEENFGPGPMWFVDETAYAGLQPADNGHPKNAQTTQDNGIQLCDTTSNQYFANFNKGTGVANTGGGGPFYYPDCYLSIDLEPRGNGASYGAKKLLGAHSGRYNTADLGDISKSAYVDATQTTSTTYTGGLFLSLSYGNFEPAPNDDSVINDNAGALVGYWEAGAQVNPYWQDFTDEKNWVVGGDGGVNSHTYSQADIIGNFKPDKMFRFPGDPNVYKIKGVTKRRLYNYMGSMHWDGFKGFPAGNANSGDDNSNAWQLGDTGFYSQKVGSGNSAFNGNGLGYYKLNNQGQPTATWVNGNVNTIEPEFLTHETSLASDADLNVPALQWHTAVQSQHAEMTSARNCRVNYLINYEVLDVTQNSLLATAADQRNISLNDTFNEMNKTTARRIEFVTEFSTTKVNKLTKYPAIFETEPKEDLGLDIYYEATGKKPIRITPLNVHNLVPIGAMVFGGLNTSIGSVNGTFVTNVTQDAANLNLWVVGLSQNVYLEMLGGLNSEIRFYSDDGGYSTATLISVVEAPATVSYILGTGAHAGMAQVHPILTNTIVVEFTPNKIGLGWFNCWCFGNGVESNRIGDTYNKPYITNGVKASTTLLESYKEEHRKYGLIYSSIYNSTSGVNGLNQFIAAEKITKDINPIYGSIQKLHSRSSADGDLIVLCEDRILKILANKDALYNADGNPQLIANNNVLGQAIPFSGEFGISKNPESFASQSYRIYFTDKVRGAVMRLSKDGLTPISDHGMKDWFRDNLKLSTKLIGSYDDRSDEYNITLADRKTLGEELISDNYLEDATDWGNNNPGATQVGSGTHTFNNNGGYSQLRWQGYDLIHGQKYQVEIVVDSIVADANGDLPVIRHNNGLPGAEPTLTASSVGRHISTFVADTSVIAKLNLYHNRFGASTVISYVSLKEITTDPITVSFKEDVRGWVSFKSFVPENALSMANDYYSTLGGKLYKHHIENTNRNNFYGVDYNSSVNVLLNDMPSSIKSYHTLDYEGSQSRIEGIKTVEVTGVEFYNSSDDGRYFFFEEQDANSLFSQSDWYAIGGGTSNTNKIVEMKQYRNNILIHTGLMLLWNNDDSNSTASPSGGPTKGFGRRTMANGNWGTASSPGDFEIGDIITTQLQEDYEVSMAGLNTTSKDGWYVSSMTTDKEKGSLLEFIEKEGKWFNYIKGLESAIDENTDFGSFDIQGIGALKQTIISNNSLNMEFDGPINASLQIGDTIYYQQDTDSAMIKFGEVTNINSDSIIVDETVFGSTNTPDPTHGAFIFFVKNQVINMNGLSGYYADAMFENNSKVKAELFAVGSEITESSK